ncbi:MAG: MBL fold metallo-hydrolase [Cyclobacteriaceae bacterium]
MKVKFYGTRGSIPICDSGFQEFGGNTTCVAVFGEEHGDILVFDAGTGIRNLGKELMQRTFHPSQKITLMFSHFHWDHIQGFPFFAPAYDSSKVIDIGIMGDDSKISNLKEVFNRQMDETYFPVQLDHMGAKFTFGASKINEAVFPEGRLSVNKHSHPGGAYGYRLEYEEKVLVYCTDVEHGEEIDQSVVELARGADLLIHEAQYTPEELPNFKGWGHSSWEQAIEVAEQAGVKKLYLTHHDPDHDDSFLRAVEKECQSQFSNCFLARDGLEVIV